MKKFLFASVFEVFGTLATANEAKSNKLSGFEVEVTTIEAYGVKCCTATVTYHGEVVKTFTECNSGSYAMNCGLVKMFAQNFVKENGGGNVEPVYDQISDVES